MSVHLRDFGFEVDENELKLYLVFSFLDIILFARPEPGPLLTVRNQLLSFVSIGASEKCMCLTVINVMNSTSV